MSFYEAMKAAALLGAGGGNGNNLLTSTIEVGTIDSEGVDTPNSNRLRTKDASALSESGDYSLFFTADDTLYAWAFKYSADGTFIERIGYDWQRAPLTFTAEAGQQFRFIFNSDSGSVALSPSDLHNLMLVKN